MICIIERMEIKTKHKKDACNTENRKEKQKGGVGGERCGCAQKENTDFKYSLLIKPGHMEKMSAGCLLYLPSLKQHQTMVPIFIRTVPCSLDCKSPCKSNYCCKWKISSSLEQYWLVTLVWLPFFWRQTWSVQTSQDADFKKLWYSRVILQHNLRRIFCCCCCSIDTHLGVYFVWLAKSKSWCFQ